MPVELVTFSNKVILSRTWSFIHKHTRRGGGGGGGSNIPQSWSKFLIQAKFKAVFGQNYLVQNNVPSLSSRVIVHIIMGIREYKL